MLGRYIVYRTENTVNGKFYYGVYDTNRPCKNYLGSGILLKKAIEKYGRDSFTRRTIASFDTPESAFALESLIVDEDLVNRDDCYNLSIGGKGGCKHNSGTSSKISAALKGKQAWNKGIPRTNAEKRKMSESKKSKRLVSPWANPILDTLTGVFYFKRDFIDIYGKSKWDHIRNASSGLIKNRTRFIVTK